MKPWVKVSTCPVGKYRDTSRYSSRGWNAFYTVYQTRKDGSEKVFRIRYIP